MKNIQKGLVVLLIALSTTIFSCGGPNDNKGGMSQDNSNREGSIDSSRLTNFDSTSKANGADSTNIK